MVLVSIPTFISIVYCMDDHPPSVSTIRRRCPTIPGAFRDGRRWRIDLDEFFAGMRTRSVAGITEDDDEEMAFLMAIAKKVG
ncbi:hypothetical protein ACMC9M_10410 [Pseudomonadota bacterium 24LQ007]